MMNKTYCFFWLYCFLQDWYFIGHLPPEINGLTIEVLPISRAQPRLLYWLGSAAILIIWSRCANGRITFHTNTNRYFFHGFGFRYRWFWLFRIRDELTTTSCISDFDSIQRGYWMSGLRYGLIYTRQNVFEISEIENAIDAVNHFLHIC